MLRRSGGALAARRRYCPFLLRSVDRDRYGKPDHARRRIGPHKPHDVLRWGPQVLTSAGFTGAEALRAVTSVAATACRVGDRKGRIAPGYDADLLAVDGDPLTDANALREVVAVFRAGHRVR